MSKAHTIRPSGPSTDSEVVRLGTQAVAGSSGIAGDYSYKEKGKLIKLGATTDAYVLCAAGDAIEGVIKSVEASTSAGWTIGGINKKDKMLVLADGLQATPGTGTMTMGAYVVCGTVVAKGTDQAGAYPKVTKATVQPGDVPADLTAAAAQTKYSLNAWRVVSLGTAGTGAVGTEITIERVSTGG